MLSYEEQVEMVEYIAKAYRRALRRMDISRIVGEGNEDLDSDKKYVYVIDRTIEDCSPDTRHVIVNEFLHKSNPQWYRGYFSKSRFYKVKRDAVAEFLHCLSV